MNTHNWRPADKPHPVRSSGIIAPTKRFASLIKGATTPFPRSAPRSTSACPAQSGLRLKTSKLLAFLVPDCLHPVPALVRIITLLDHNQIGRDIDTLVLDSGGGALAGC